MARVVLRILVWQQTSFTAGASHEQLWARLLMRPKAGLLKGPPCWTLATASVAMSVSLSWCFGIGCLGM